MSSYNLSPVKTKHIILWAQKNKKQNDTIKKTPETSVMQKNDQSALFSLNLSN